MNKGIILIIGLGVLIGLVGYVLADNFNIKYKVAVDEGWNLLQGFVTPDLIIGGEITSQDVAAVYAYLPNEHKYARVYPNPEVKVDDEELLNSAFWVYLKKSGWIEYNVEEEWAHANNRKMVAGWNFVGATSDIFRLKVKEWKGTCNVEKIAGYQRGWGVVDTNVDERTLADQEQDLGRGMIVKVSSDCTLKANNENNVAPPQILN